MAKINLNKLTKIKFTEVRLRKIVNYIRTNGLIPLIATSSGYYVDYSPEKVIESQIKSLKERSSSIYHCAVGLEKILSNMNTSTQIEIFKPDNQ